MKHLVLILALLPFTASAQQPAEPPLPIVGGFQKAAADDPEVRAAADFAISAAPKTYRLVEVVAARRQIVAGTNFSLCLRVKSGRINLFSHGSYVSAKVFRGLDQHYELNAWQDVKTCE